MDIIQKHSIAILIPYFGKWPEWVELFFDSIEKNSTIDFHFLTDCDTSISNAKNNFFHTMTFNDYVDNAKQHLSLPINIPNAYKICDLRPTFGLIHYDIIKSYDFYGWADIDLLFGDIRSFYTPEILDNHEVFSAHNDRISGHFALFKNSLENRMQYLKIYKWQEALENPNFVGIDEHGITNAYTMTVFDKINEKFKINFNNFLTQIFSKSKRKKLYMVEQYTTPFTPIPWLDGTLNSEQPSTWFYDQGKVTNDRDNRDFIYLHFMNFKSSQWRHDGTKAPWEGLSKIYHIDNNSLSKKIKISPKGIYKLEDDGRK
ncbi:MAG: hypothetical protein RL308_1005 [Bacteroidota bacterium]|jgi:hypothetical protein